MACIECVSQATDSRHAAKPHQTHSRSATQETLFDRLSSRLSCLPDSLAQHNASDYISEIQDLVCDTYQLSRDTPDPASPIAQLPPTPSHVLPYLPRPNPALDQALFTQNLIKRLSLTRCLTPPAPNTLPPAIETYFEANTILLKKPASLLPGVASALSDQLHPLLALNIRHLEFHLALSFRPIYCTSARTTFEVKPEHFANVETYLPRLIAQLPRLRTLVLVLDSLFDSPPRPRDYQRLLQTKKLHGGRTTREENLRHSNLEAEVAKVVVLCLRSIARERGLERVAVRHAEGMWNGRQEREVVDGVGWASEDVARAVLEKQGREVVLEGWVKEAA